MFYIYLMTIEDEEERRSIERIYEEYRDICFYSAMKIVRDKDVAEDIVQEVFVKLIKHRKEYLKLHEMQIKRLVIVMAKNLSIDYYRDKKKNFFGTDVPEDAVCVESVEDAAVRNSELQIMLDKINELDEDSRRILYYRASGMPVNVIADTMNMSKKNVEVKIYRARKRLKDMLEKEEIFRR